MSTYTFNNIYQNKLHEINRLQQINALFGQMIKLRKQQISLYSDLLNELKNVKNVAINRALVQPQPNIKREASAAQRNAFAENLFRVRNTIPLEPEAEQQFQEAFRVQARARQLQPNECGFIEVRGKDKLFFADPETHKVLYRGVRQNGRLQEGSFKKMKFGSPNQQFIGLVPGRAREEAVRDFQALAKKGNSAIKKLNLKTVFCNTVVRLREGNELMIGRNAGTILVKCSGITLNKFKNAAQDLKTLHQHQIYLLDIKPDNMAFDGKRVNFIDVDDSNIVIQKNEIARNIPGMCPHYTTRALSRAIEYTVSPEVQRVNSQVSGEYAFLLSIIETTQLGRGNLLEYEIHKHKGMADGVIGYENKRLFQSWIKRYVKPEYHFAVECLLTDPAHFANVQRPVYRYPHIADMLNFS